MAENLPSSGNNSPLTTIDVSALNWTVPPNGQTCKPKKITKQKNVRWTWDDDKVEALLDNLYSYKCDMTYKGLDFEADLVSCYMEVRNMMALMYSETDFGPEEISVCDTENFTKEELLQYKRKVDQLEKLKKDGYSRIKSKVKEVRSGYKTAIDKGTRSGSGHLVQEHFVKLQEIWGGSPAVTALNSGKSSISLFVEVDADREILQAVSTQSTEPTRHKIHNNKRDKMKKKLSAHQRDMLLLEISREELAVKKQAIQTLKESTKSTEDAILAMTKSVSSIGESIKEGLALLANSFQQSQQHSQQLFAPTLYPNMNSSFLMQAPQHQ